MLNMLQLDATHWVIPNHYITWCNSSSSIKAAVEIEQTQLIELDSFLICIAWIQQQQKLAKCRFRLRLVCKTTLNIVTNEKRFTMELTNVLAAHGLLRVC